MKIGKLRIYVFHNFGGDTINDYYVYEHIRLDNNTCFYIGKGHGKRYLTKSRNKHHDRIASKYGMKAVIVKDGLSEEEAYKFERYLIYYYVFELGYGIDIEGFRKDNNDKHLTNYTFGGDGSFGMVHSDEWKKKHSEKMKGQGNPMYGVNLWDTYSDTKAKEIKAKISIKSSGKNNAMYGVSPKDRMSDDVYHKWYKKNYNRCKNQIGANNPNYHNDTLKRKLTAHPELKKLYYPPKYGSSNANSKSIFIYKDDQFVNHFSCITECCEWLKSKLNLSCKISSMRSSISESLKNNKTYHGYTFLLNTKK